ncbi:sigma-70 family RNA polymerase sigma factor [bacterium]|nr:sigma-70 family RNA polymerase sigma factor [bacterium]
MQDLTPQEERELIQRILAGATDEFRLIVLKYQELIVNLIFRQTGDRDVANDLAQETFIKVFKGLSRFRGEAALKTWITRIAINTCNTYFRSRAYRESRLRTANLAAIEATARSTSNPAQDLELSQLQHAIATLNPIFREVLVLCGIEQRSYEEVSKILNIPVGTVRSRLNRARLLLSAIMFEGN